jgi:hypothetical protein
LAKVKNLDDQKEQESDEVAVEATQEKPKDTGFSYKMKELDEIYGTVDKRI